MTREQRWIYCPHCGAKEPDGVKFCGACGSYLGQDNHTSYQKDYSSQTSAFTSQSFHQQPYAEVYSVAAPMDDFDPKNLPPSSTDQKGNGIIAFYIGLFGCITGMLPLGIGAVYFAVKAFKQDEKDWQTITGLVLGIIAILSMIAIIVILVILFTG